MKLSTFNWIHSGDLKTDKFFSTFANTQSNSLNFVKFKCFALSLAFLTRKFFFSIYCVFFFLVFPVIITDFILPLLRPETKNHIFCNFFIFFNRKHISCKIKYYFNNPCDSNKYNNKQTINRQKLYKIAINMVQCNC